MLPIILDLTGRKALVVGGGRIAYRKAKALADEGAHVTVISPDFVDDFSPCRTPRWCNVGTRLETPKVSNW